MGYIELNEAEIVTTGGAEVTLAGMDEWSRDEIGRKTYRFVRRIMRDPAMKAIIRARAEEIRANGEYSGLKGENLHGRDKVHGASVGEAHRWRVEDYGAL